MYSMIQYKVKIDNFQILEIEDNSIIDGKISYSKNLDIRGEKVVVDILLQLQKEQENIYKIELTFKKELYQSELKTLAEKLIKDLLNKIAFFYMGVKVGEPWLTKSSCKDKKLGTSEFQGSVFINAENRDRQSLKTLCVELKGDKDFNTDDHTLFRSAMNNEDVVVKYMFLYQILSYKHMSKNGKELQSEVDKFIMGKFDKDKHMYQNWQDTNRKETIYTRLRNQVGHFRKKTPLETRNDMSIRINDLIELVKISIE